MLFPGEQFELKQLADHNNFLFFLSCFFWGGGVGWGRVTGNLLLAYTLAALSSERSH